MGISFRNIEEQTYSSKLSNNFPVKEVTLQQIQALRSLGYKIKNVTNFKRLSKCRFRR